MESKLLTERQRAFVERLPVGCQFYTVESLRDQSRTCRVHFSDRTSAYILHVEYDKDDDVGTEFRRRFNAVVELYNAGKAEREAKYWEEFEVPF